MLTNRFKMFIVFEEYYNFKTYESSSKNIDRNFEIFKNNIKNFITGLFFGSL